MKLDFTAIRGNLAEKPLESPITDSKGLDDVEAIELVKSPQRATEKATDTEQAGRLLAQYKQEQAERERTLEAYRDYQRNIKESKGLRTEILKGIKAGEPPIALLLKAIKCISLMTGEAAFYSQIEGDVASIYGAGLLEREPLELELRGVQGRLQNLQKALERGTEPADSRQRIERAIQAHRARESQLKSMIETGKAQP